MSNEIALSVESISKRYTIGMRKNESFRGSLNALFNKNAYDTSHDFWALKDISFEINKGDVVGIIGRNGAGKSTLLKLLSQITRPTEGTIKLYGRVASLLEVGTGFHQELTGRENIYLNGTILGMTRDEVKQKFDEIVAFSGIEKFIDTPVKHYSSGMYVRLAFAVAAHLEPEILIIDEVLAVGDAEFQKKCLGKMQDVAGQGRTVLFVSHQLSSIKQLCTKGILLQDGQLQAKGPINDIIQLYQTSGSSGIRNYQVEKSNKDYYFQEIKLSHLNNEFYQDEIISVDLTINTNMELDGGKMLLIRVMTTDEIKIFSSQTSVVPGKINYTLQFNSNLLTKGEYQLNCILYHPAVEQYDQVNGCCNFVILSNAEQFAHLEQFDIGLTNEVSTWV